MVVSDVNIAAALQLHQDAVVRLAAMPGLGVDSAQPPRNPSRIDCRKNPSPDPASSG
jgi:hypothetical protein